MNILAVHLLKIEQTKALVSKYLHNGHIKSIKEARHSRFVSFSHKLLGFHRCQYI